MIDALMAEVKPKFTENLDFESWVVSEKFSFFVVLNYFTALIDKKRFFSIG